MYRRAASSAGRSPVRVTESAASHSYNLHHQHRIRIIIIITIILFVLSLSLSLLLLLLVVVVVCFIGYQYYHHYWDNKIPLDSGTLYRRDNIYIYIYIYTHIHICNMNMSCFLKGSPCENSVQEAGGESPCGHCLDCLRYTRSA